MSSQRGHMPCVCYKQDFEPLRCASYVHQRDVASLGRSLTVHRPTHIKYAYKLSIVKSILWHILSGFFYILLLISLTYFSHIKKFLFSTI